MTRERYAKRSLGVLQQKIKLAKVLLVGAGGIGCELLKNLVLLGFGEIHVVDLDTIDLSNLNRQFLFRREHIKRPKAIVAKESASRFNPQVQIEAHHANIKDPEFSVAWFKSFNIVFNALDNLDARRHVNRMCLAAERPLIESGTTGFNGQVQVIIRGRTECYDCNPKETPKTYPVCTIRSTPSQSIHCVVWAKSYLFTEVFGLGEDEDNGQFDHSEDVENAQEIAALKSESEALKRIRDSMGTGSLVQKVFDKVFHEDIVRLQRMEDMWKTRRKPEPLDFATLSQSASLVSADPAGQDQASWSLAENFIMFKTSTETLSRRLHAEQSSRVNVDGPSSIFSFDKDDEDMLNFVTASSNLRSHIFGIETKTKFDVKQMAGNIIPAIATTNAMTAGLCVMQAFKVMREDYARAKMVFLERPGARVINSDTLRPPNPECSVCGVTYAEAKVDLKRATLEDLVEPILKDRLGYSEFSITNEVGILYDPDLEENLPKKLTELGIKSGTSLSVVDDGDEETRVNLVLSIVNTSNPPEEPPISLPSDLDIPMKAPPKAEQLVDAALNETPNGNGTTNGHTVDGIDGVKRKRSIDDVQMNGTDVAPPKKTRLVEGSALKKKESAVVVDGDPSDESIVIED